MITSGVARIETLTFNAQNDYFVFVAFRTRNENEKCLRHDFDEMYQSARLLQCVINCNTFRKEVSFIVNTS